MEKGQTLFNYLYDALVRQIVSGKLSYGEKLPSLRSLCQIYQVGIRTVRDVTEKLIREGYIESVQRSHIKVCYLIQGDAAQQAEAVLSRRNYSYRFIVHLIFLPVQCPAPSPLLSGLCQ